MKKKIIFFHPYSVFGGADLSISKLIDCVPKEYEIDFVTLSKNPKIKFYTKRKIKIIFINKKSSVLSIFRLRNIINKNLKTHKNIILLSNQNFANIISLIASFKLKNVKKILFDRNHISELDNADKWIATLKNKLIKILIKVFYRFSDLILGNSYELSKDLSNFCGKKVIHLNNFYNFEDLKKKSHFKLQSKIKFKKNIIINVGRLVNQKNQILLLESFKIINQINKKINLLIIGDGNKYDQLKNFILFYKLNNNVQILNNVKNSLPYIKNSDLYVSTSKYEGFPNVIIEALTLNVPVISTKYKSGISEILLNGKGGKLLDKENPENLAREIMKFFNDKKVLQIKTNLAKKKLERFSYKIGKKNFERIINSL